MLHIKNKTKPGGAVCTNPSLAGQLLLRIFDLQINHKIFKKYNKCNSIQTCYISSPHGHEIASNFHNHYYCSLENVKFKFTGTEKSCSFLILTSAFISDTFKWTGCKITAKERQGSCTQKVCHPLENSK